METAVILLGLGWFLSFCLTGWIVLARRQQTEKRSDLFSELQNVDLPWCLLRFPSSSTQHPSPFPSSRSFLSLIQRNRTTWQDLVRVLGEELDSPFQQSIRDLLQGKKQMASFDIMLNGQDLNAQLWSASARPRPHVEDLEPQNLLLTLQPSTHESALLEQCQTLSKERTSLMNLLTFLPIPIWTRNRLGRLTFCNAAYAKRLKTQPHQVLSRQWELVDGEEASAAHHLFQRVLAEGGSQSLSVKKKTNGFLQDLVITETAFPASLRQQLTEQEPQLVGMALPISVCFPHLEQQKQQFESVQALIQSLNQPLCVFSLDAHLLTFTQAFAKLLSLDTTWLLKGVTALEILERLREQDQLPEYVAFSVIKAKCQKWFTEPSDAFRAVWPLPSGQVFDIMAQKESSGFVLVSLTEVTQKLSLEGQLKSLTAVWEFVVTHALESLFVVGLDHRVQKASQKAALLLDLPHEDLLGRTLKEILTLLSKRYGIPGGCASLEDALELRKPHQMNLTTTRGQLACEYVPLPDGCHLLRFFPLEPALSPSVEPLSLFASEELEGQRRASVGG